MEVSHFHYIKHAPSDGPSPKPFKHPSFETRSRYSIRINATRNTHKNRTVTKTIADRFSMKTLRGRGFRWSSQNHCKLYSFCPNTHYIVRFCLDQVTGLVSSLWEWRLTVTRSLFKHLSSLTVFYSFFETISEFAFYQNITNISKYTQINKYILYIQMKNIFLPGLGMKLCDGLKLGRFCAA